MDDKDKAFLRRRELAERFGVSTRTLDRWRKSGQLKVVAVRQGGLVLFPVKEVESRLQALAVGGDR